MPADDAVLARRDPLAVVVRFLRDRRWARRGLSALSVGLLLGAVALLGYPFYTNLYQYRLQIVDRAGKRSWHSVGSAAS